MRDELALAMASLDDGQMLNFLSSRPMPDIGKGVHELRLRGEIGIYRVTYWLAGRGEIWFIHAFKKTTEKTSRVNILTAKQRLGRIQHEKNQR